MAKRGESVMELVRLIWQTVSDEECGGVVGKLVHVRNNSHLATTLPTFPPYPLPPYARVCCRRKGPLTLAPSKRSNALPLSRRSPRGKRLECIAFDPWS